MSSFSNLYPKLKKIMELSPQIFSGVSESYRQKVVFKLLNILKTGNKEKFLSILLWLINARKTEESSIEFIKTINELYLRAGRDFEKWAYTVIMGIMSAKTKGGE